MESARRFFDSLIAGASAKETLASELETRCAHRIPKKKSKNLVEYKSLSDIKSQFMTDVIEAVPFVSRPPPS
eukprot:6446256-Pyramimonas_sp.AAC.1